MAKQNFFLRGECIGSREIPTWTSIGDPPTVASSYLLICGKCMDIWGKVVHEDPRSYCQLVNSHCREHALFPSDATFTSYAAPSGDARSPEGGEDLPQAVAEHDVVSLADFFLNNPDKDFL